MIHSLIIENYKNSLSNMTNDEEENIDFQRWCFSNETANYNHPFDKQKTCNSLTRYFKNTQAH